MNLKSRINKILLEEPISLKVINGYAPAPAPWGVLYAKPNPDGSKKKCDNCVLWVTNNSCLIHSKNTKVNGSMVCGYHVFGTPATEWRDLPGIQPVEADTSGLEEVGDGTSCDTCMFYDNGKCMAVASENGGTPPVDVEPKGCCARWTAPE